MTSLSATRRETVLIARARVKLRSDCPAVKTSPPPRRRRRSLSILRVARARSRARVRQVLTKPADPHAAPDERSSLFDQAPRVSRMERDSRTGERHGKRITGARNGEGTRNSGKVLEGVEVGPDAHAWAS